LKVDNKNEISSEASNSNLKESNSEKLIGANKLKNKTPKANNEIKMAVESEVIDKTNLKKTSIPVKANDEEKKLLLESDNFFN